MKKISKEKKRGKKGFSITEREFQRCFAVCYRDDFLGLVNYTVVESLEKDIQKIRNEFKVYYETGGRTNMVKVLKKINNFLNPIVKRIAYKKVREAFPSDL